MATALQATESYILHRRRQMQESKRRFGARQSQAVQRVRHREATLAALVGDRSLPLTWVGMRPDQWQRQAANSVGDSLMLCSRQVGKSMTASAIAISTAFTEPNSLVLVLSPSQRQSSEVFRDKILRLYDASGQLVRQTSRTATTLELDNGSRIVSLPENEEAIRGFSSVRLLVIDEAARVADALYFTVRPMLAVSRGRLIALSTPFGKRGWFHEEWSGHKEWQRFSLRADQCTRISRDFLEMERLSLGERWFNQEYMCSFEDTIDAVFLQEHIDAAFAGEAQPLF